MTGDSTTSEERHSFIIIYAWVWEYILKRTTGANVVRELAEDLPLPKDLRRLRQMVLLRDLTDLLTSPGATVPNVELVLRYLESLECSLAGGVGVGMGESLWRGFRQHTLESQVLEQPLLELRGKLRILLGKKELSSMQYQVLQRRLSALTKAAWTSFGTLALEKAAAVVAENYKPEVQSSSAVPAAPGAVPCNHDHRIDELRESFNARIAALESAVGKLDDGRRVLDKLVKEQGEACKRHGDSTGRGATSGIGLSLLDPRPSAHTFEWDEDNMEEDETPSSCQLHNDAPARTTAERTTSEYPIMNRLGSELESTDSRQTGKRSCEDVDPKSDCVILNPKQSTVLAVSPLASGSGPSSQRRVKKKWSDEEVLCLKQGVHDFGKGNWKRILASQADVFRGHTEVDIKDKWRNMEKYSTTE